MINLLIIKEPDVVYGAESANSENFKTRKASRAVLLDDDDSVYLIKVGKHNYHKLPGGGIKEGEDTKKALARELLEEVGCTAEITDEIGTVVEYRDQWEFVQTSYCYIANKIGNQVKANFEEDEIAEGMHEVKASSIDEAIRLLKNDEPDNYEGRFIKIRDTALLKKARIILKRR